MFVDNLIKAPQGALFLAAFEAKGD